MRKIEPKLIQSKREVATSDVTNSKKTSGSMAKKNIKHPRRSKYHSAIAPKTSASMNLSSTVGSSTCNNLGNQAVTMVDELRSSQTPVDSSQSQEKEGVDDFVGEQMTSKGKTNPLVAAKVAKAAAKASAAVEGHSNSLPVLPEIIPFHKFARREKFSVKVAVVDWKNRIRPDVRSPCFSSFSSGKAQTAFHVGVQKVKEWSLDLIGTCGKFDSLEDGGFGFYEDYVSLTTTPSTSRMGEMDNEHRTLQLQYSESDHVACVKAESSFKDASYDLSLVRDKGSLRDSLDEEFEDRSICGPENMVDCRNSALESSSLQGQPAMGTLKLTPNDKIEAINKAHRHSEKKLGLKPMRTSDDNISLEKIKSAVLDYVVNLLTPLYKTRKIQKDGFKLIVKKVVAKVMERDAPQEAIPDVSEFLNSRRKTKIRALVDRYIEMQMSPPQSRDGLSTAS